MVIVKWGGPFTSWKYLKVQYHHPCSQFLEFETEALGVTDKLELSSLQVGVFGNYAFDPRYPSFYTRLSAGVYKSTATITISGSEHSSSENDIGLGFAVGYEFFGWKDNGIFLEAAGHYVFSEDDATYYVDLRGGYALRYR